VFIIGYIWLNIASDRLKYFGLCKDYIEIFLYRKVYEVFIRKNFRICRQLDENFAVYTLLGGCLESSSGFSQDFFLPDLGKFPYVPTFVSVKMMSLNDSINFTYKGDFLKCKTHHLLAKLV